MIDARARIDGRTAELADIAEATWRLVVELGEANGWSLKSESPARRELDAAPTPREQNLLREARQLAEMYLMMLDEQLAALPPALRRHSVSGPLPSMRAALELAARLYYLLAPGEGPRERVRRFLNEKIDSNWELAQIWFAVGRDLMPIRDAYLSWQKIGQELGHHIHGSPPADGSTPWMPKHRGRIGGARPSAHELLKQLSPDPAPRWLDRIYKELSAVHGSAHLAHLMATMTLPDKAAFHGRRLVALQYATFAAVSTLAVDYGWPYHSTHRRATILVDRTLQLARAATDEAQNLDPGPSRPS